MRHPPSRGARMTVHMSYTSFPRTQGEAPSQYYVSLAGFFVNKYVSPLQLQNMRIHFWDQRSWSLYDPHTSFPRTQGEAPSQYYVPLAGFFVNEYLPSLQLQKHWICVFIFEINMRDPHTTSPSNFHAYTIPKLEILHIVRSKIFRNSLCIWPLKNSVLKYNF